MPTYRFLKLYSCCFFTDGACKSLLLDTQRGYYYQLPLSVRQFVEYSDGKDINSVLKDLDEEQKAIVEGYIDFLITNECAFFCDTIDELECFPEINLAWHYPHKVSNMVIEIDADTSVPAVLKFLENHFIPCIVICVCYPVSDISQLDAFAQHFSARTKGLQIHFKDECEIELTDLKMLSERNPVIEQLVIYNSNTSAEYRWEDTKIIFTEIPEYRATHCGQISKGYFNPELSHYSESQTLNTCMNRKVCIDRIGNIKNCPSMNANYGNIASVTLHEILKNTEFKRYWNISKNDIHICQDCEFRHICTDCRAYLENPNDIYSKPLKCGYDPYTNEWSVWSTNRLKRQAILHYGLQESKEFT